MIDTSPDLRRQALRFQVNRVDAVVFTHSHADHVMGFDDLRSFNFVQRSVIPCYGTPHTIADLKRTFYYVINPPEDYKGGSLAQVAFTEISYADRFSPAGVSLQAFPLMHGDTEVAGFRIGNLAYATDCSALTERAKEVLEGVEHLVIDALRHEPHYTHFTIAEAIAAGGEVGAKNLYLTHLSHRVDYPSVSRDLPGHVQLAYDGMKIPFTGFETEGEEEGLKENNPENGV